MLERHSSSSIAVSRCRPSRHSLHYCRSKPCSVLAPKLLDIFHRQHHRPGAPRSFAPTMYGPGADRVSAIHALQFAGWRVCSFQILRPIVALFCTSLEQPHRRPWKARCPSACANGRIRSASRNRCASACHACRSRSASACWTYCYELDIRYSANKLLAVSDLRRAADRPGCPRVGASPKQRRI